MSSPSQTAGALVNERRMDQRHIHFVEQPTSGDVVLMHFKDPTPRYAVISPAEAGHVPGRTTGDTLDVVLVPLTETKQGLAEWGGRDERSERSPAGLREIPRCRAAVASRPGGASMRWRTSGVTAAGSSGVCALRTPTAPARARDRGRLGGARRGPSPCLRRKLCRPAAWRCHRQAHGRRHCAGACVSRESNLTCIRPTPKLTTAAQKLGEELRERAGTEARAEIVDGQIEVFEHVYEMSSQRMGEYRAARQGHIMEWVIIVLLAAEALLMLAQTLLRVRT